MIKRVKSKNSPYAFRACQNTYWLLESYKICLQLLLAFKIMSNVIIYTYLLHLFYIG